MPKCLRCDREFDSPIPKVTNPEGHHEIACRGWCSDCNALAMSLLFRHGCAYRIPGLPDPLKGRLRKEVCDNGGA